MTDSIFLLQDDGSISHMDAIEYDAEVEIQRLLAQHPELIPGAQINPDDPRRWLFISREVGVPNEEYGNELWSLDHLLLDQDAIPTFVEVKRSANSQIRREVVGQMMDYAANATAYWPEHRIREFFDSRCEADLADPDELVRKLLTQDENVEVDEFWERVRTNLRAGKVRLLFVADRIPTELRRIVEFLNSQMDPAEVLAVELPQYLGSEQKQKAIVPRVLGRTTGSDVKKGQTEPKIQWNEDLFFASFEKQNDSDALRITRSIYDWAQDSGSRIWWGSGKRYGSCVPTWEEGARSYYPFVLWTNGKVEIQLQHLHAVPDFDAESIREEFRTRLSAIDGIDIPISKRNGRPSFPVSTLKDNARLDEFYQVINWFIKVFRGDTVPT
jgi:hypothetical protein